MKKGFFNFVAAQYRRIPPVETADLSGQTIIVTGANAGLGFEATKHFARMNPGRLIMACRSEEKGRAALEKVKKATGCNALELWTIDLADFSSVTAFAERFEKEGARLDILVANAGVASFEYTETKDGWEQTLQVNNLATSLLCILLAPRLVETGKKYNTKPRIVVVASTVHYWTELDDRVYEANSTFEVLSDKKYCTKKAMEDRYSLSKLLNVFFVRAFADILKDTPVIVDCLCPGYCYSELRRQFNGIQAVVDRLMEKAMAWTTEEGGRQLVYGAIGSQGNPDWLRGAYLDLTRVTEPSDHVLGEMGKRRQDKLWVDLVRELAKVEPRVPGIVKQLSQ